MKVLILRFETFPFGSAPAFRALTLAKLVVSCGHKVIVLAKRIDIEKHLQGELGEDFAKVICYDPESMGVPYSQALEAIVQRENPDVAIRPSSMVGYQMTQRILQSYHIPTVLDSVEWHNATNWRLHILDPRYYKYCLFWRFLFPKREGIIAISRMIESYYRKYVNNVVRIPTVTDCKLSRYRLESESKVIRFVFAGQLDRGKDNLDTFIQAMVKVDPEEKQFQLDIYGPTTRAVRKHLGKNAFLLNRSGNIHVHGRVPQKEAQDACLNSDYSVFFRLNRRSANAGFPTKLGECMTFGTPVICNNTGDISLVVNNLVNGYLLETKSVDEIAGVLRHILESTPEERMQMRIAARRSAEAFFDYRNYQTEIQRVLSTAVARKENKDGTV